MTIMGNMAWFMLLLTFLFSLQELEIVSYSLWLDTLRVRWLHWRREHAWRQVKRGMARSERLSAVVERRMEHYLQMAKECREGVQAVLDRQSF